MIWHDKNIKSVLAALAANKESGLSDKEAAQRLYKYGKNEITAKKKDGFWKKFSEQFKDFMIIVLIVSAIVSGFVGIAKGEGITDTIIIMFVIIFMLVLVKAAVVCYYCCHPSNNSQNVETLFLFTN